MATILFVYPTIFNPRVGGVERVTDVLAREFVASGKVVYYLHHEYDTALLDYDFPAPLFFFPNPNDFYHEENVAYYQNFLKKYKVDIVINQYGNFAASRFYTNIGCNSTKVISVLHANPLLNYELLFSEELVLREKSIKGYLKLVARFFLYYRTKYRYLLSRKEHFRYLFPNSDRVVFLSSSYVDLFNIYGVEYQKEKVITIPNPCSFVLSHSFAKKKKLLYVGRLESGQKRPDRLMKIWKQLYKKFPDWEMVIVGDGKERKRLEQQAKGLERISFVGFQSPEKYYCEAAIFCMTSNLEGFPMVLPEAMVFGVIPFAFDSFPAVHDIIEDGKTGVLVKPFSIKDYANKLASLMSDEEKRNRMSASCMTDVTRFSLDNIVNQWEELFKSLA